MDEQRTRKQWCVVTGATAGIGRAVTLHLLRSGFGVVGVGRNEQKLAEISERWPKLFLPLAYDVTDPGLESKLNQLGVPLDDLELAVHCAGCAYQGMPLTEMTDDHLREMVETNVLGTALVVRDMSRLLARRRQGTLVVVGSVAAHDAAPLMAVYAATKAFAHHLVRCVRTDLHGSGVRIVSLQPGTTRTGLLDGQPGLSATDRFSGFAPLETDDIARMVEWIHHQPPHINMQEVTVLPVDQSLYVRGIHRHYLNELRPRGPQSLEQEQAYGSVSQCLT